MENKKPLSPQKVLLVLCTASFLVPFMGSSINLAMPQIGETFSMKAVTLTWLSTIYLISTAIFQVPFARLADLIGRKKVFEAGILCFAICCILCGFAPSGATLIGLRFLTGLGSAMQFGTSMAILSAVFPQQQRGKAMGINSAVVYAALAAGPLLGGLLTHYFGWRSLFIITGTASLSIIAFSHIFLNEEWVEAKGEKFDWTGSLVYGLGLFGLIYGFTQLPHLAGFCLLAGGITALVGFVFYEKQCSNPVFNLRIFSGNRVFAYSSLSALINYAATAAVTFMLSLYLQYIRGYDARHAGLILITQACIQAIFSVLSGRLSDKIHPSRLATLGMGLTTLGLMGITFITATTPVALLILLLLILGIGFGIFASPNTNVIMSSVDKKYYGQASATTGTVRLTGQALSMGIAGMAIALKLGDQKIQPAVHSAFLESMKITFIIFVALCAIGIYASSQRKTK
jgi:MFS family permease